jgi:hypothetical protein
MLTFLFFAVHNDDVVDAGGDDDGGGGRGGSGEAPGNMRVGSIDDANLARIIDIVDDDDDGDGDGGDGDEGIGDDDPLITIALVEGADGVTVEIDERPLEHKPPTHTKNILVHVILFLDLSSNQWKCVCVCVCVCV